MNMLGMLLFPKPSLITEQLILSHQLGGMRLNSAPHSLA